MRLRKTSTVSMILPLVLLVLLMGLLVGCGGGDQSGGGQQKGNAGNNAEGELAKKEKLSRKIAIGTVRAYKDDRRRLSLRPAAAQGDKPLGFKVRKKAQVTLDGKQAELGDIEEGQQAQIRYVVENEVNRAIIVQLFSKQPSGEDKKEKKPSGEGEKSG